MIRYKRLKRMKRRAWDHMFTRGASFAECDWWATWWYRLDDAANEERWCLIEAREWKDEEDD